MSQAVSRPVHLRCEYLENPLGLDERQPRLSWRLDAEHRRGARQVSYQLLVSSEPGGAPDLWDSGKVVSGASLHVPYAGKPLHSRQRAWWRVRVWDERGRMSESTERACWETGLLERSDWRAQWIAGTLTGGRWTSVPAPYLRKTFFVGARVTRARLYATALGLYEARLNGQRIGDLQLAPGWTDYRKRVHYQSFDVTPLLVVGDNTLGAILGDGWYCGHVAARGRQLYGDRPKFLAQLVIDYLDGRTDVIGTDSTWRFAYGPLLESDLLMGESYDARLAFPGWDRPGFDDRGWQPARMGNGNGIALDGMRCPPIRALHEFKPRLLQDAPDRRQRRYDFGQNLVGRVRLRLKGAAGATVTLRHAEMLDADGRLYLANLRSARATDHYTLRGDTGGEVFEPRFTFHGFRYLELETHGAAVEIDEVTGVGLHSDLASTGEFSCSDPLVNQLQKNIQWSQRGNLLDVPTDCPQRDERLGWTGDAQIFVRTAAFNMNVAAFYQKWMQDLADAQTERGTIPAVAPAVDDLPADGGPGWADAVTICPWTIYQCYGDRRLLERHYGTCVRFVDELRAANPDLIRRRTAGGQEGYGDWLALDNSDRTDGGTPKELIGTAFFAHSARLVAAMAEVLGKKTDARRYTKLAADVRAAFQRKFLSRDGAVAGGTQTASVLALHFDLVPAKLRPRVAAGLVADIEKRGWKLATGFVGSPYLPYVLTAAGRLDVAFKLLHQKQWPSWLYPVTQGATTIWERWDGWTHDRGFQNPGMNSFNHYAGGAIGEWLYAVVTGIEVDPARPGYQHILLQPHPGGNLSSARARLASPHGEIASAWRSSARRFDWEVIVPANTTATARLPVPPKARITEGGKPLERAPGVAKVVRGKDEVRCELAAGRYRFAAEWPETK
ncbi:MAG TPA: glycoside hydrolase family 78 protein [Opitutaceae bacterium]|nr:glycoside hydrolase family 78 protein [Opitutaceae bacterium]